ncbi:MAG: ABC transporter permease [Planctomycetes bacterium]|nr:ABC transporter permease [Planctomycetota bacterium]
MTPVFLLFLRRLLFARRTLFFGAIAFLPCLFAIVFRLHPPRHADALEGLRKFLAPMAVLFLGSLLPMFFGTTAFGDEIEGKTIPYLLTRPRPRLSLLLAKSAAVVLVTALLLVSGFLLAAAILRGADPFAEQEVIGIAFGVSGVLSLACLTYGCMFIFLGLTAPHPVLWGLLFCFGWEGFVGLFPGELKALTVQRYLEGLLTRACDLHGEVFEGFPIEVDPPGPVTCVAVLLTLAAVFTALSNRVLRRRDFAV